MEMHAVMKEIWGSMEQVQHEVEVANQLSHAVKDAGADAKYAIRRLTLGIERCRKLIIHVGSCTTALIVSGANEGTVDEALTQLKNAHWAQASLDRFLRSIK